MKRMHDAFPNRPASSITVKQWLTCFQKAKEIIHAETRQVLSQLNQQ